MIPTRIGQVSPGGYFAGVFRIDNMCFALIVSPQMFETNRSVSGNNVVPSGTRSLIDGLANTRALSASGSSAAQYCKGIQVDQGLDFYLPSDTEIEMCYYYLKPSTNKTFFKADVGQGSISITRDKNKFFTQTIVLRFQKGNSESFDHTKYYATSSEPPTIKGGISLIDFSSGFKGQVVYEYPYSIIRPVRRIQIV